MEETKNSKLPKNVKQIGQAPGGQKVYIEDYVITYLKQMLVEEKKMKTSILYGHKEIIEDELYWFVSGAIEVETDFFMEKTIINEEAWKKVNALSGRFFQDMTILGWAVAGPEIEGDLQEQIMRTHRTFFRPDQKLFFEYLTDEKQENLYFFEKGKMKLQAGYYIYYDKNECMQNYMVSLRASERHPEEFEADHALQQIRESREEKRLQRNRKKTTTLLTCFSMILVTTIMIIGITMLNNYEKMQSMEKVLYQISGKIDQAGGDEDAQETAANLQLTTQETMAGAAVGGLQTGADAVGQEQSTEKDGQASDGTTADTETTSEREVNTENRQGAVADELSREENETADATVNGEAQDSDAMKETAVAQDGAAGKEAAAAQEGTPEQETVTTQSDDAVQESAAQPADGVAQEKAEETTSTIRQDAQTAYVIQRGDTLVGICMKYYGNLSNLDEICSLNGIEDKDSIFYGQKIILP